MSQKILGLIMKTLCTIKISNNMEKQQYDNDFPKEKKREEKYQTISKNIVIAKKV